MDAETIREEICRARRFSHTADGFSLLADHILPQGGALTIHFQQRGEHFSAHDGGSAFDELAKTGGMVGSLKGVRRLFSGSRFRVTDDGVIWLDHVKPQNVPGAIALLGDASARAARFLVERAAFHQAAPLERRLKDALAKRFVDGRPDFTFVGQNKQHVFDFGVVIGDNTLLAEAVSPEASSVATAVIKAIDARAAAPNVIPIFAFDPEEDWSSPALGMLDLAEGVRVEIGSIGKAPLLRLAA